jgi:hypothetical protein
METHCEPKLLSRLGIWRYIHWFIITFRCQIDLEDICATQDQNFLLVDYAWQILDGGQAISPWIARLKHFASSAIRPLRQ